SRSHNDVDLVSNELGRNLREALVASFRPAILDRDRPTLDPAEFMQSLRKSGDPFAGGRTRALTRKPDSPKLPGLLRTHRERPRGRAAEQRNELAATDHSITSSAWASNDGGTLRPSACAVIRLMTSSNLVGCSTGKSPGLAPRRILST